MAIARFPTTVLDCADPGVLAEFYGTMLGWKVDVQDDWVDVRSDQGQCLSFQKVDDYRPPRWPDQEVPQQMHLDVVVDDLDAAEPLVLDRGGDQGRAPAGHHVPGVPRPGGAPVLPLPQLRPPLGLG